MSRHLGLAPRPIFREEKSKNGPALCPIIRIPGGASPECDPNGRPRLDCGVLPHSHTERTAPAASRWTSSRARDRGDTGTASAGTEGSHRGGSSAVCADRCVRTHDAPLHSGTFGRGSRFRCSPGTATPSKTPTDGGNQYERRVKGGDGRPRAPWRMTNRNTSLK